MNKIEKALDMANYVHSGQTRISGEPYIFHPIRVAQNVYELYPKFTNVEVPLEDAVIIALLHDTIEDTDISREEIEKNFGPDVLKYVLLLSRLEENGKKPRLLRFHRKP